jgi:methyltransferase (TIGR00027 family)
MSLVHPDRPSLTASLVAALRALYTEMPEPYRIVEDPLAAELVPDLLALPARALSRAPVAGAAVHRAIGFATLGLSQHIALRTRAIDDAVRDAMSRFTQIVVLGAGLDNRAMRMDELSDARVFEVDHPTTQRYKLERLARAGAPPPKARALTRVAVDFERDRLDQALSAAGLRSDETTMWIWEGVTVYLTDDAITETLRVVAALSSPGSRIALTYGLPGDQNDSLPAWAVPLAGRVLGILGEPLRSPLTPEQMNQRLSRAGFRRLSDESTLDWGARYWPGQRGIKAIERLAVAERQP